MRNAVRFADGLQLLGDEGYELFVEIGTAHRAARDGTADVAGPDIGWLPSLQRGEPAHDRILPSLGALWIRGGAGRAGSPGRAHGPGSGSRCRPTPGSGAGFWMELEEFPGRQVAGARWLVAPQWETRAPTVGNVGGNWKVVGTGPDAERVRRALTARGARIVDSHPELAGLVVVPSVPGGDRRRSGDPGGCRCSSVVQRADRAA